MEELIDSSWCSYPRVYALGQRVIQEIFSNDVLIEEKIDGSQFSFGKFGGELRMRSKSAIIDIADPEKMFRKAVDSVLNIKDYLKDGWTYRAEYLMSPKHNTLAYDRTPVGHLIGFDICTSHETYLDYDWKKKSFEDLGYETVPQLRFGAVDSWDSLRDLLETVSCLGKQKIEGIVVKNYNKLGDDGKVLIGKFVSEEFKEVHGADWKVRNPGKADIIEMIISKYHTPARWNKAIQHLTEAGSLDRSPKDIGPLMKEVAIDIEKECSEEIKDALYDIFWPQVRRGVARGLPQWYKEKLAKETFETQEETV